MSFSKDTKNRRESTVLVKCQKKYLYIFSGKLVDLICANNGNGNNNKSWMRVKGIVSKIDSSSISIQVQSMVF